MTTTAQRLADARARLEQYRAAESRVLQSQEYVVGQAGTARRNRRAELDQITRVIRDLEQEIQRLEAQQSGRRPFYLRPMY